MIRHILAVTIVACSVFCTAAADERFQTQFDEACQSGKFIGAALITLNGKPIFSSACGWADAQWSVKDSLDTRFPIASITKEFTAAAVLLLYQGKKFVLTDPIGKYVPSLPQLWQSATIHQLLTHTSGIPIYTGTPDYKQINPDLNRVNLNGDIPTALLDLVRDRPLMHAHGEKFTYNNTGYILLGMLIEKVSGIAYSRFIQERIFDRLQMRDSGYDDPRMIVPHMALGYTLSGAELRNADRFDPRTTWSAGALYSTVGDLARWSDALANGELLNTDSTERLHRVYPIAASQDPYHQIAHYGYGVVMTERFNHHLQYHGGGFAGFNSVLQRYPEVNLVIAVLSNLDSDADVTPSWTVADSLAKVWFESNPNERRVTDRSH